MTVPWGPWARRCPTSTRAPRRFFKPVLCLRGGKSQYWKIKRFHREIQFRGFPEKLDNLVSFLRRLWTGHGFSLDHGPHGLSPLLTPDLWSQVFKPPSCVPDTVCGWAAISSASEEAHPHPGCCGWGAQLPPVGVVDCKGSLLSLSFLPGLTLVKPLTCMTSTNYWCLSPPPDILKKSTPGIGGPISEHSWTQTILNVQPGLRLTPKVLFANSYCKGDDNSVKVAQRWTWPKEAKDGSGDREGASPSFPVSGWSSSSSWEHFLWDCFCLYWNSKRGNTGLRKEADEQGQFLTRRRSPLSNGGTKKT